MLSFYLKHSLLAIFGAMMINSEFQIKEGVVPSYLWAIFDSVDDAIFPMNISMQLYLTKVEGTLLYSIDANGNQLIMKFSGEQRHLLQVEFRKKKKKFSMEDLCGCTMCAYHRLVLTLTVKTALQLQCNKRPQQTEQFDGTIALNPNFPLTKPSRKSNSNSAYLWLINTPQVGTAYHNPQQLQGCIFSVEYKNRPVSVSTFGTINNQCNQTCTPNVCNGGVCYETYTDKPICDCSYTFGSGPTCLDESRIINKRFNASFHFSNIKLSWLSDEKNIFEMGNKLLTLTFNVDRNILSIKQKYLSGNVVENEILTESYSKRRKYIIIMNFGSPTIVQVLNETKTVSSVAISNGMFEYITFSSGTGVIDMAYKTENSDLSWKQLSSIIVIPTSKRGDFGGNNKLWALVVIFVALFLVLFFLLWIRRNRLSRRKHRGELDEVSLLNVITQKNIGKIQTLHFESFSVVCCQGDIQSFTSFINEFHKQLLPLKNPTIVCQLPDPTIYLPSNIHLLQLDYNDSADDEFVVLWNDDGDEQVKSRIEQLRAWSVNVKDQNNRDGGKISFKTDKQSMEPDWRNYHCLTIDGLDEPFKTVHLLLRENWSINKVKETLIDFLKTFHSGNILRIMKEQNFEKSDLNECLNRLMKLKMQLISFIDKDKLCVYDSVTIDECSNANDKVTMQECDGKVVYVPPLFESMTFEESVQHLLFDKTLFIHSITDESCIVMARVRNETPSLILSKILPFLPDCKEINFVYRDKILTVKKDDLKLTVQKDDLKLTEQKDDLKLTEQKDDLNLTEPFDSFVNEGFLQCAVVLRYSDPSIRPIKMEGKDRNDSTMDVTTMYRIDETIYVGKRVEDIKKEIIAMAVIGTHERIIKCRRFCKDQFHFYIFMDAMKDNLKDYVAKNSPMTEVSIIKIGRQILEGLAYLHEKKILYLNLKTSNVLLNQDNIAILSDFEESKYVRDQEKTKSTFAEKSNYTAPEILQGKEHGSSADIWSFGIVMVEMVTGRVPFEGMKALPMVMTITNQSGIKYHYPKNFTKSLKTVIDSCLTYEQKQRKTCAELLEDDVFKLSIKGNKIKI